jgi:hypothetical protein
VRARWRAGHGGPIALEYTERRRGDVEATHRALLWRPRRRTDPAELAARYDAEHLLACDTFAMRTPRAEPDLGVWDGEVGDECGHCRVGHLVDHDQAAAVPVLADRLDALRDRLAAAGPAR